MAKKETAAGLLRSLREAQGRSLRTVANELGVAASQLSRMERGQRRYTRDLAERLATYYGISPEMLELLEGRVPADIVVILQEHPEEIVRLRHQYGGQKSGAEVADGPTSSMDSVLAEK